MPKMSGFELYSKMKACDNGIKVIFLTALKELSHYEDFKKEVSPKAGERHFIQKPITDVELIRAGIFDIELTREVINARLINYRLCRRYKLA